MLWQVVRAARANADLVDILRWTAGRFGPDQAQRYGGTIVHTLNSLHRGPELSGARLRPDLGIGLWSIKAAIGRIRGRHIVLFTVSATMKPPTVTVLRILHDLMDLTRHLPNDDPT